MRDHVDMPVRRTPALDIQACCDTSGVTARVVEFGQAETIFSQGDASDSVMYVSRGGVRLSARSKVGREAVVAMLGQGDFFGEDCLAGQSRRKRSATAIAPSAIYVIGKPDMVRLLHAQHALSDRFIRHLLTKYNRIEADLIDQLFDSIETRLAQALLLLAGFGTQDRPRRVLPSISQGTLAAMVGTTRSRVNVIMKKFTRLGFIERSRRRLTVDDSLLSVVLHD
jgi:CRP/FNR family transcriptional regulator, cyclic AMP receptor protein